MTYSVWFDGWLEWRSGNRDAGLSGMRDGRARLAEAGLIYSVSLYETILAEAEAEAGETDAALATIDRAIAESERTGQRWYEAESHRVRGEILFKQNPADPAPAEGAFLTAIAVAQAQKARSFELRAALSLAKLYRASGRDADGHVALGPALEGFSPTPEFPEIAEAQGLLEALAQTDGVKADAARRAQRLKLQASYGQAVMWSKGYAAEETKTAFARAGEFATEIGSAQTLGETYYARFGRSLFRGELGSAREAAESFLREAEREAGPTEVAAAHRVLGLALLFQGDFAQARAHCEQTLRIYDPERDREAKFRLGPDSKVAATSYLALAAWCLGGVAHARELIDEARARRRIGSCPDARHQILLPGPARNPPRRR